MPLIGAAVVLLLPRREEGTIRGTALVTTLATFAATLYSTTRFSGVTAHFELAETVAWIPAFNIYYRIGVDGVSFLLILLTNLLMPIVILSSWHDIQKRIK